MSHEWRPTYHDPRRPAPVWLFVLVLGLAILAAATWLAVMVG